jgi:carotenoid cleavage dioxygenase-like enzyme
MQEPIFVPRSDPQCEDDGWVLSMVYRAATNTTDLAILDARRLSYGPVALIHLPTHIPHGESYRCCRLVHSKQR